MTDELYDLSGVAASLGAVLSELLGGAREGAAAASPVELTVPARAEHGDLTTNAALVSAKRAGRRPRELAQELGDAWLAGPGAGICDRIEVAGPGFLNLFLHDGWYHGVLGRLLREGADYGRDALPLHDRQRLNVEFVSVNPTGPLHVGHARYAAYGDALCRIFSFVGHEVTREFYVNDFGTQMLRFAISLAARYGERLGLATQVPADGYAGEYLLDLADRLIEEVGERYRDELVAAGDDLSRLSHATLVELRTWGRDAVLAQFGVTLERLGVALEVWTSESSLYTGGAAYRGFAGEVGRALADLDGEGLLYEKEDAVWLRTTEYGDDKDRVLIRSTGEPTYFLSDIAYHRDKLDRGFAHLIDIWGADHHGYVPRMKAAFTALPPHEPERLELLIGQLVNLLEGGEVKRMSKRRGDIVTVDDLIDAIGVDAARFLLVGRSHDTALDLDLDLAVEQSNQNPVYYVQYAHARICSILRNLEKPEAASPAAKLPEVPVGEHERSLLLRLARFPEVVLAAAALRAPQRVHGYLGELAEEFHVFYRHCRVLSDDPATVAFRGALCTATKTTLACGLALLGVGAPHAM